MNDNERITILGSFEGGDDSDLVYLEIARLLAKEFPDMEVGQAVTTSMIPENSHFAWQASISARTATDRIANALWKAYSRVLQAHTQIADHIRLVFKLQDEKGNFVRVQFADPYSDKGIFLHRFGQNMQSAFGLA